MTFYPVKRETDIPIMDRKLREIEGAVFTLVENFYKETGFKIDSFSITHAGINNPHHVMAQVRNPFKVGTYYYDRP